MQKNHGRQKRIIKTIKEIISNSINYVLFYQSRI